MRQRETQKRRKVKKKRGKQESCRGSLGRGKEFGTHVHRFRIEENQRNEIPRGERAIERGRKHKMATIAYISHLSAHQGAESPTPKPIWGGLLHHLSAHQGVERLANSPVPSQW